MAKTYQQIVERGARIMARIIKNTSNITTVHALAEDGLLAPDLFRQISNCAAENPDKDIIIYVQRVDMAVIKEALKKRGE